MTLKDRFYLDELKEIYKKYYGDNVVLEVTQHQSLNVLVVRINKNLYSFLGYGWLYNKNLEVIESFIDLEECLRINNNVIYSYTGLDDFEEF